MMKQNIKFIFTFETIPVDMNEYLKQQEPFYNEIIADMPKGLSFQELSKLISFDKQKYYITSIEFPDIEHDFNENRIETTTIEINGNEY